MPGITNPSEFYFKGGLWGWTGAVWECLSSFGGRLFTALHGWDGAAWRKLPLIFGYSDHYSEIEGNDAAGAGYNGLTFSIVPAGELWVVTHFAAVNQTSACDRILLASLLSGATTWCDVLIPAAQYAMCVLTTQLMVPAGGRLIVGFYGCTAGDDIYAYASGYKMKIAE